MIWFENLTRKRKWKNVNENYCTSDNTMSHKDTHTLNFTDRYWIDVWNLTHFVRAWNWKTSSFQHAIHSCEIELLFDFLFHSTCTCICLCWTKISNNSTLSFINGFCCIHACTCAATISLIISTNKMWCILLWASVNGIICLQLPFIQTEAVLTLSFIWKLHS